MGSRLHILHMGGARGEKKANPWCHQLARDQLCHAGDMCAPKKTDQFWSAHDTTNWESLATTLNSESSFVSHLSTHLRSSYQVTFVHELSPKGFASLTQCLKLGHRGHGLCFRPSRK
ncbi:unnamed protein product, partial [Ixodes pacificus]